MQGGKPAFGRLIGQRARRASRDCQGIPTNRYGDVEDEELTQVSRETIKPDRRGFYARLAAVLGVGALIAGCGSSAAKTTTGPKGPVNIGVISGFTGSAVSYADEQLAGVQVAQHFIDQNGGILGAKVNVIPVDDGLDPVDAVTATDKMLATDNVSMEAGLAALDYINALPILNRDKMVSFSYIGPSIGATERSPYHFNMNPLDSELGAAMAYYAKSQGYTRIALVFDTSSGAQSIVPALKVAAQRLHLDIVADPTVPQTALSYETAINQVVAAKPDAVLMQVEPAQAGAFFQQWKSLGAESLPIIGTDFTLDSEWLKAVGQAEVSAHVLAIEAGAPTPPSPFYNTVAAAWQSVTGHPISYVGESLYDGVTLGALAMVEAKSTNPQVYDKYIRKVSQPGKGKTTVYSFAEGVKLLKEGKQIKYSGITGPLVFNSHNRPTGSYGVFRGQVGGNPTEVGTIAASKLIGLS